MKIRFSLQILFIVLFFSIKAQKPIVDSLKNQLALDLLDSTRINIQNELAFQLYSNSPKEASKFAQNALELSQKSNFKKGEASALVRLGSLFNREGNSKKALALYAKAIVIRGKLGDNNGVAGIYNNIALVHKQQGHYNLAIDNYVLSLDYLTNKTVNPSAASIYNNLGNTQMRHGDFASAIKNINQSIQIRKNLGDEKGMANNFLNLGNLYETLNNSDRALINYEKALTLFEEISNKNGEAKCRLNMGAVFLKSRNFPVALKHLEIAARLQQFLGKNDQALVQLNLGSININKKLYKIARPFIQESLNAFTELGNEEKISQCHYNLGLINFDNGQFQFARDNYQQSLIYSSNNSDLFFKTQLLYNLSETCAKLGDFDQAFSYSNSLAEIQDSLNHNYKEAMNLLIKKEEEEKNMAILKKEKEQKSFIVKALIGLFILFFLAILGGFIAYRNRKKRQLAEKNEQLALQKINDLLTNQELKSSYARLEGQHKERKRIAQDLHDRLGSMLSTVKLYFKAIDTKIVEFREENHKQYQIATDLLDEACEEVRKVAHNLESGVLTEFGLKEELQSLAESIENSNQLKVKVLTHGLNERLEEMLEIKIYRIIQELVNNAIKHSKAQTLSLQLNKFKEILNILVVDDGIGFDPLLVKNKGGMGLKNIESRVNELHGSFQIDSDKGNGTTISIDIPC